MDLNASEAPRFVIASASVGAEKAGLRMQEALIGMFPRWLPSRKACRKALDRGLVELNGTTATTARRVAAGDSITLLSDPSAPPPPGKCIPSAFHFQRPEAGDYLLVWKPAGISTSGTGNRHLAAALAHLAHAGAPDQQNALKPIHPDALVHPQPVHRLDRATAGWVCVALTLHAADSLGQAFAQRRMQKRYLALVAGSLIGEGHCNNDLDGKTAKTTWKALGSGPLPVHGSASLVEVVPETGRTHQIRRHLAGLGHPIVGEDLYAHTGPDGAPLRYVGQGLFLSAIALAVPQGVHGPALEAVGTPPRKFSRITWVRKLLPGQEGG